MRLADVPVLLKTGVFWWGWQKCAGPGYVMPFALNHVWRLSGFSPVWRYECRLPAGRRLWSLVPLVFWLLGLSLCQSGHLCKQPALSVWPLQASAAARPLCVHVLWGMKGGYVPVPFRRVLEKIHMGLTPCTVTQTYYALIKEFGTDAHKGSSGRKEMASFLSRGLNGDEKRGRSRQPHGVRWSFSPVCILQLDVSNKYDSVSDFIREQQWQWKRGAEQRFFASHIQNNQGKPSAQVI